MNFVASGNQIIPSRQRPRGVRLLLLAMALFSVMLLFVSCASEGSDDAQEVQEVIERYLSAAQSGDLDRARSYWTDINNPGGSWSMVARRDMEHVTRGHISAFKGGYEVVESRFEAIEGLSEQISVLKLDAQVQPGGEIKKLEVGLVEHEGHWYIYSIYPGDW